MLIPCPACGRVISVEAEACPQCGHPNRSASRPEQPAGPTCYACSAPATTRCQRCETFSCPVHLQSINVGSGGRELRCKRCYSSAVTWWVVVIAVVAAILIGQLIYHTVVRGGG